MKRFGISLVMVFTFAAMLMGGQGQAAAVSAKAVELAQAAAPATKVDYPTRSVSVIVPFAAGGGTSVAAEMMATLLEKILKTPFQVLYRPGGGTQVGLTELMRAKPDGYTIGYAGVPTTTISYLDPERKTLYNRKSFQKIATHFTLPHIIAVRAESPYKTLKDLVDAAKAKPEGIKFGDNGFMGVTHLGGMLFEKAANIKFASVHFDGDAPTTNALLGGHVDATCLSMGALLSHITTGGVRPLGVMDSQESPFLPGVKTLASQGYDVMSRTIMGVSAPAGTPPGVLAILADAIKKAQTDPGHQQKMTALGFTLIYVALEEYEKIWADVEARFVPLLQEIRKK